MPRNGDQYYPYRQNSDFYYLTGIEQEESLLLIIPDHPEAIFREHLLILQPTPLMEIWEGHKLTRDEAGTLSGIEGISWIEEFDAIVADSIKYVENLYFNFPENPKFSPRVKAMDHQVAERIENQFPGLNRGRLAPILTRLRMIKEAGEIELIKRASKITGNAFRRILPLMHAGLMEYEVEAEITHEYLKSGASGHAYEPIIASGKNALVLHYVDNNNICNAGDLVLMDFGAELGSYAADCTRTIPVSGRFTDRQKTIYYSAYKVFKEAIRLMTAGKKIDEYHTEVGRLWEEEHIKLGLYSQKDVEEQDPENPLWKRYYMHGTSHSIGLDVHDPFDRSIAFTPGMVMSCEPAIYILEENLGIRLENTILITQDGPDDLMKDISVDPEEIESLMNP